MIRSERLKFNNVLLLNPAGVVYLFPDGRPAHRKHCMAPLGLAYVAAGLIARNYDVKIVDILAEGYGNEELRGGSIVYGLSQVEILGRVAQAKPDIIGVSVLFSSSVPEVYRLCRALKENFPDIPIVMGGQHPTGASLNVMENNDIDYCMCGESDINFPDLLDALNGDRSLDSVKQLVYRQGDKVVNTMATVKPVTEGEGWNYYRLKEAGIPQDILALPRPAWHLFPMESYWNVDVRISGGDAAAERYGVIVSTRGCPWACYYCTSPLLSGFKGYRKRTNDDVIDEIRWLVNEYDVGEVMFLDDNFFVSKRRAKDLVRNIREEFDGIKFSVPGGTDVNQLDEEMVDLLASANFYKLTLNIESGNQEIQDQLIDKDVKLQRVPQLVDYIRDKGIETKAMLMIGFPGERRDSIEKTIKLARSLNVDDFFLSIVAPLPGTPLFDECKEKGLFIEGFDLDKIRYSLSTIRLPDTTPEELEDIRKTVWQEAFEERRQLLFQRSENRHRRFLDIEEYETFGFKLLEKGSNRLTDTSTEISTEEDVV